MYMGSVSFEDIGGSQDMRDILRKSLSRDRERAGDMSHYPYELEKKLYAAMLEGDLDGIRAVSREYGRFPISVLCEGNPVRSLKNMMICNCALITRVMIQAGLHHAHAYFLSDSYINKIESLHDKDSLIRLNGVMILDFISVIKHGVVSHRSASSPLVRGAVGYIEENVYETISLGRAAGALHVNSSYLSRVFKREMGVSFTEYAHRSRMKKAEQLLLLTDVPIASIAIDLGYSSQSHFTKTFKRIRGTTPHRYRLDHEAERLHATDRTSRDESSRRPSKT